MREYRVCTDGGARGNPGPAGVGVVVADEQGKVVKEYSAYVGEQTNNWAEYEAVIRALGVLKKLIPRNERAYTTLNFRMDSELIARQLSGEYQVKETPLQLQYMKIHNIRVADFPNMTFTHVPREKNRNADRLANNAMDKRSGQLF